MSQSGYIYVLYNSSVSGAVKIGKTQRNPEDRARELSSATGVPTPFVVVYQCFFKDCDNAEMFVHTRLDNCRLSENREFFQIPIYEAIDTLLEAKKYYEKSEDLLSDFDSPKYTDSDDEFLASLTIEEKDPATEICEAAEAYYYGYDETIQDYNEAFKLYLKAAKLGSAKAFFQLGRMCRDGEGRSSDLRQALDFFKEGIKHGNDECWAEMAMIFNMEGHNSNEEKCWNKYFYSKNFNNFGPDRPYAIYDYVFRSILNNRPINYKEQIIQVREEVIKCFQGIKEFAEKQNDNSELPYKCIEAVKGLN